MPARSRVDPGAVRLLAVVLAATAVGAQDAPPVAKIWLERLDRAVYHLLDARAAEAPERGFGLLVVIPGGDGGAHDNDAFLPFVSGGIHGVAAPDDFVTALCVATSWHDDQRITWATAHDTVRNADWPVEKYVDHVIADVSRRVPIDPQRIVLVGWGSGGPAVHASLLREERPTDKGYVTMSVFVERRQDVRHAEGLRVVLDQSPDDAITPLHFAITARASLSEHGAAVWLRRHGGGHGFGDRPLERIASAIGWLTSDRPVPDAAVTEADAADAAIGTDGEAVTGDLLINGSFEDGTAGWRVVDPHEALAIDFDTSRRVDGAHSLELELRGDGRGAIRQDFDLDGAASVEVSAWIAGNEVGVAWLRFFAFDADGAVIAGNAALAELRDDREGDVVARTFDLGGRADRGVITLTLAGTGTVWLDDVRVVVADE